MMQQKQSHSDAAVSPLPTDLGSDQAKLVYLYLEAAEAATAEDLQASLSMKKISVLSVLRSLADDGLVERDGNRYRPSQ